MPTRSSSSARSSLTPTSTSPTLQATRRCSSSPHRHRHRRLRRPSRSPRPLSPRCTPPACRSPRWAGASHRRWRPRRRHVLQIRHRHRQSNAPAPPVRSGEPVLPGATTCAPRLPVSFPRPATATAAGRSSTTPRRSGRDRRRQLRLSADVHASRPASIRARRRSSRGSPSVVAGAPAPRLRYTPPFAAPTVSAVLSEDGSRRHGRDASPTRRPSRPASRQCSSTAPGTSVVEPDARPRLRRPVSFPHLQPGTYAIGVSANYSDGIERSRAPPRGSRWHRRECHEARRHRQAHRGLHAYLSHRHLGVARARRRSRLDLAPQRRDDRGDGLDPPPSRRGRRARASPVASC